MNNNNYVKNYLNGEIVTLDKFKPETKIKGTGKIELFNAETGELEIEAKTENCINDVVAQMAFMDYFYNKIKGDTSKNYYSAPFNNILLTDYDKAENSKGKWILGKTIGWANKSDPYSGTDAFRGTINKSETKFTIDPIAKKANIHFVFDFPTNASNGTFQTIWWNNSMSSIGVKGDPISDVIPDSNSSVFGMCSDKDFIYLLIYYKDLFIFDKQFNLVKRVKDFGSNNSGIAIDPYDCKWIYRNGGGVIEKVSTFDLKDVNYKVLETIKINVEDVGKCNNFAGLTVLKDKILLNRWSGGAPIAIDKNTGNQISIASNLPSGIYSITEDDLLITSDGIYNFNLEKVGVSTFTGCGGYDKYTKNMYYWEDNNREDRFYRYILYTYGAQTLLASPITKTNKNTMKLTYDFVVDWFDM